MKVLRGGLLIDGTGKDPIPNASVVIDDTGQITHAGTLDQLPTDAQVIDVAGKTIMPGLIDAHVHFMLNGEPDFEAVFLQQPLAFMAIKAAKSAQCLLAAGFTTVRDVGAPGRLAIALRQAIRSGLIPGPRILAAGQLITATSGHADFLPFGVSREDGTAGRLADGPVEILRAVREQVKAGADLIKFCATGGVMDPQTDPDAAEYAEYEAQALVSAAHTAKRPVAAHAHGAAGVKVAVRAGVDTIEHGTMLDEEAARMMQQQGVFLVPTFLPGHQLDQHGSEADIPPYAAEKFQAVRAAHSRSFQMAVATGVPIALGTDAGTPYYHHGENAIELQLMVEHGLSPMETIVAATSGAARALRVDQITGSLAPGKLADLLIVDGNPLADIALLQDTSKLLMILLSGHAYKNLLGTV